MRIPLAIVKRHFEPIENAGDPLCPLALHVEEDPIDGTVEVSLYTDDGRGNGTHLFTLPLDALRVAVEAYAEEG